MADLVPSSNFKLPTLDDLRQWWRLPRNPDENQAASVPAPTPLSQSTVHDEYTPKEDNKVTQPVESRVASLDNAIKSFSENLLQRPVLAFKPQLRLAPNLDNKLQELRQKDVHLNGDVALALNQEQAVPTRADVQRLSDSIEALRADALRPLAIDIWAPVVPSTKSEPPKPTEDATYVNAGGNLSDLQIPEELVPADLTPQEVAVATTEESTLSPAPDIAVSLIEENPPLMQGTESQVETTTPVFTDVTAFDSPTNKSSSNVEEPYLAMEEGQPSLDIAALPPSQQILASAQCLVSSNLVLSGESAYSSSVQLYQLGATQAYIALKSVPYESSAQDQRVSFADSENYTAASVEQIDVSSSLRSDTSPVASSLMSLSGGYYFKNAEKFVSSSTSSSVSTIPNADTAISLSRVGYNFGLNPLTSSLAAAAAYAANGSHSSRDTSSSHGRTVDSVLEAIVEHRVATKSDVNSNGGQFGGSSHDQGKQEEAYVAATAAA